MFLELLMGAFFGACFMMAVLALVETKGRPAEQVAQRRTRARDRATVHAEVTRLQLEVIDDELDELGADGTISLEYDGAPMALVPEARTRLDELGFVVSADGRSAQFASVGG